MSPALDNLLATLHVLCSNIGDVSFSLMWGALLALGWKSLPDSLARRVCVVLAGASMALALAQPLQLALLTITMTGAATVREVVPELWDVLSSTHAGRMLAPQFAAALVVGIVAVVKLPRGVRFFIALLFLLVVSAFKAASGHAASNGDFSLREMVQAAHLISIAAWAGGIMIAGWVVLHALSSETAKEKYVRSLSRQATCAVVVVFLSGAANTWLGVDGSPKVLITSAWGAILLAKIVLVLVAMGMGAANRRQLQAEDCLSNVAKLCSRIRAEAWVMLAILILSAWLGNTSPSN